MRLMVKYVTFKKIRPADANILIAGFERPLNKGIESHQIIS